MMPFPPRVFHKEFLEINMLGTVPYLVDGDVKMTESVAMCQYIAEKFGPTDLLIDSSETDYPNYLNWLYHRMLLYFPTDSCYEI